MAVQFLIAKTKSGQESKVYRELVENGTLLAFGGEGNYVRVSTYLPLDSLNAKLQLYSLKATNVPFVKQMLPFKEAIDDYIETYCEDCYNR
jgi:hypothetical protein